jgi:ubiquinone biosynthesis protein COQ9
MNSKQHALFDSVLTYIPQSGWTSNAFEQGAKDAGLSLREAQKLFPRCIDDVVAAFHGMIDDAMQAKIEAKRNFAGMRVRDKITFAVRTRLETVQKYENAMHRLLVRSLMPRHLRQAGAELWRVADAIWMAAGDTSTDYNYYTKRILLMAVMKSTLAYWLNDASPNRADTWAFLDRRIEDVMVVGKGLNVAKAVGVSDIVSFVRSRFAA